MLSLREACRALLEQLEFAREPERDAQVLKLDQVDAQLRVLGDALEHLEELLAAVGLAMQRVEKSLLRPIAVCAPGRRQHRLIERGAQRITSGDDHLIRGPCTARALFEVPYLIESLAAERGYVSLDGRAAHATNHQQDRCGGAHQRIESLYGEPSERSSIATRSRGRG